MIFRFCEYEVTALTGHGREAWAALVDPSDKYNIEILAPAYILKVPKHFGLIFSFFVYLSHLAFLCQMHAFVFQTKEIVDIPIVKPSNPAARVHLVIAGIKAKLLRIRADRADRDERFDVTEFHEEFVSAFGFTGKKAAYTIGQGTIKDLDNYLGLEWDLLSEKQLLVKA